MNASLIHSSKISGCRIVCVRCAMDAKMHSQCIGESIIAACADKYSVTSALRTTLMACAHAVCVMTKYLNAVCLNDIHSH